MHAIITTPHTTISRPGMTQAAINRLITQLSEDERAERIRVTVYTEPEDRRPA